MQACETLSTALSIFAYPAIKGNVTNVRLLFRFHILRYEKGKRMRDFSGKIAVLNGGGTGLGRRRWLFLLFMGFTSGLLRAEILDCERLSDSQRKLCEELARCSIIDSAAKRTNCVSGVLQTGARLAPDQARRPALRAAQPQAEEPLASPVQPAPAKPVASTAIPVKRTPAEQVISTVIPVKRAPAKSIASSVILDEPVPSTARPVESGLLSKLLTRKTNRPTALVGEEIPRLFYATVLKVRTLVRNRQLVLLDSKLLFEGAGPAFKIGDNVKVEKQGRFGNRYIIGRSKGRQLEFKHLRCERRQGELGENTRRKCKMLLGSD